MVLTDLRKYIIDAATHYYNGEPIMSDEKFDSMVDQLRELSPDDILLKTPGWGSKIEYDGLELVTHDIHIKRGLDVIKTNRESIISDKVHYDTLKYDGASVTLYYDRNGDLEKAVTRNDGITGTDVTSKLKYIVPNHIDVPIHAITGEWILSKEMNAEYYHTISPRNVAVGILKRKTVSPEEVLRFDFVAYRIVSIYQEAEEEKSTKNNSSGFPLPNKSYSDSLNRSFINSDLKQLGFNSAPLFESVNDYYGEYYDNLSRIKHSNGHTYEADGIVVDYGISKTPVDNGLIRIDYKDEIAYKVINQTANVVVSDVIWNHTRTGKFVPRVKYNEVFLSGAMCSYASAFNAEFIKKNGIGKGAEIKIVRSGEVIPHILEVSKPVEPELPERCECGSKLVWDGVDLVCRNPYCETRQYNRLYNYIAKVGATKGVSSKIIDTMIEQADWSDIKDIYINSNSWINHLDNIKGIGSSSVNLIKKTYNYLTNNVWFDCWILGLSLPGIGKGTVDVIKTKLLDYLQGNQSDLWWTFKEFNGVGNAVDISINANKEFMIELFNLVTEVAGWESTSLIDSSQESSENNSSAKLKVCITGKISSAKSKSEFYSIHSDKIIESDVNSCDILICSKAGSSKYNKAIKLGKKIVSEDKFLSEL